MVNKETVIRKLNKLKGYLQELATYELISWEEYSASFRHRRTVERLIQLIVDVAVDINTHTVVDEGHSPPKDAYSSFFEAAKLGIFPHAFAKKIAPSTGERNIIVHEYEQIDDAVIYHSIKDALKLYSQYIDMVLEFLED
ncbi:type VII toxin-antitoxin system HepT family RNase toxin [Dethiobacter alkaliphilus]|uniref:type VII toxin-antitoxin system HepT family RNase toxin n=1 Tax=Dethiobacter alkaliphilus TaxID=427926 RepID=UPI002227163C|nr:DUF86 domain-containing protein [Dethiobacter alkaliphilus]MCW3488909.1 DUF86 domain-containing protein [Dethiobacter alkaliphilus]